MVGVDAVIRVHLALTRHRPSSGDGAEGGSRPGNDCYKIVVANASPQWDGKCLSYDRLRGVGVFDDGIWHVNFQSGSFSYVKAKGAVSSGDLRAARPLCMRLSDKYLFCGPECYDYSVVATYAEPIGCLGKLSVAFGAFDKFDHDDATALEDWTYHASGSMLKWDEKIETLAAKRFMEDHGEDSLPFSPLLPLLASLLTPMRCKGLLSHSRKTVIVMGAFKVGKTWLTRRLAQVEICNGDEIENTKGEILFHVQPADGGQDYVLMDTEGLFQVWLSGVSGLGLRRLTDAPTCAVSGRPPRRRRAHHAAQPHLAAG
jgi:hypothetical protein